MRWLGIHPTGAGVLLGTILVTMIGHVPGPTRAASATVLIGLRGAGDAPFSQLQEAIGAQLASLGAQPRFVRLAGVADRQALAELVDATVIGGLVVDVSHADEWTVLLLTGDAGQVREARHVPVTPGQINVAVEAVAGITRGHVLALQQGLEEPATDAPANQPEATGSAAVGAGEGNAGTAQATGTAAPEAAPDSVDAAARTASSAPGLDNQDTDPGPSPADARRRLRTPPEGSQARDHARGESPQEVAPASPEGMDPIVDNEVRRRPWFAPTGLRAGLAYVGSRFGSTTQLQHGVTLEAAALLQADFHLGLSYVYFFPAEIVDPAITIAFTRHRIALDVGRRLGHWAPLSLEASVAGLFEVALRDIETLAAPLEVPPAARAAHPRAVFGAALRLRASLQVYANISFFLAVSGAWLAGETTLEVSDPVTRQVIAFEHLRLFGSAGMLIEL